MARPDAGAYAEADSEFDRCIKRRGEAVSLVGSNGAGKTTLLRAISGLIPVWSGSIVFDGEELTKLPAHTLPGLGIAHIPQGRGVLSQLTVNDNLILGAYTPSAKPQRAAKP